MNVSTWLRQLGLEEYTAASAANHVDGDTLRQLTADDLRDLGVNSVGHRRRLLAAIATLDQPPAETLTTVRSDAERRPVSVLFVDLCGFTAMSHELPDERLHSLLGLYLATADEIVKRLVGTVDKHIGDAVMALLLARRTAMGYWGPALLAYNAWLEDDEAKRRAFLVEAESLLAGKGLGPHPLPRTPGADRVGPCPSRSRYDRGPVLETCLLTMKSRRDRSARPCP